MVATICWWRLHAATLLDWHPALVFPNRVVEHLAYEMPRSGGQALAIMRGYAARKRAHQDAFDAEEALQKEGGAEEPVGQVSMLQPLRRWQPGWVLWASAWHLAWTLQCASRRDVPAQVRVPVPCAAQPQAM